MQYFQKKFLVFRVSLPEEKLSTFLVKNPMPGLNRLRIFYFISIDNSTSCIVQFCCTTHWTRQKERASRTQSSTWIQDDIKTLQPVKENTRCANQVRHGGLSNCVFVSLPLNGLKANRDEFFHHLDGAVNLDFFQKMTLVVLVVQVVVVPQPNK